MEVWIAMKIVSPPADVLQNEMINDCRIRIESKCYWCGSKVIGVPVRESPGQYSMECKNCGKGAIAFHDRGIFFADD
jgi:hypothetical protein